MASYAFFFEPLQEDKSEIIPVINFKKLTVISDDAYGRVYKKNLNWL